MLKSKSKTEFHVRIPSWMKWSKLKNEVQTGEVVKDGPKSMSSDESSNQRIYGNIMEDVNENRRFIQLKDIIHFKDDWGTRARKFLDEILPKSEGQAEVQAEYRPRLHVGTFNIMRDLTGLYHGPPLWQEIYIYFTISSSPSQKPEYNYYYTLEPESNRAKKSFKIEENICDQHNMSKRKRRSLQKKVIEPWVIYKQEFSIHPCFQHLPSIIDLRYKRFKDEYYQQATFKEAEGVFQADFVSPSGHYSENKDAQPKQVSSLEPHPGMEDLEPGRSLL